MKTFYIMLIWLVVAPASGFSQSETCGSKAARDQLIKEHPEILQQEAELEQFTKNFTNNFASYSAQRSGSIVIPVVFHIIHQAGAENISDAQVLDEIRILNEDYNKRNADTASVLAEFKTIIADIGIEFRLANIDPNGNCTNGIDRIFSCQTYMGNDYSKLNNWPREKYLNVWVVKSMRDGVAGYAYYPGSVQNLYNTPAMDGVIILSNYIGAIGTGNYGLARALTHEIGHYLNLQHPWGNNNEPGVACGDDEVNDTPVTRGSTSCNVNLAFCNPPQKENVQNYMDYSYCSKMFTEGQKARMLAALNSSKAQRNNLYTASNLIATGTDDTIYSPCAPVCNFGTSKRYVCVGSTVTLLDASANGEVTDYYWEIPNGNPAISTDKNPQVQFLTTGWQPIKLTITGPLGSSVKENNMLVYVANDLASYIAPVYQDFEDPNALNNNEWLSVNYDQNNTEITRINYAAHTGSGSAQLNNYFARTDRDIDELLSPGFDLSALTSQQLSLSFYYSWATSSAGYNPNPPDSIEVQATNNCGASWITIYKTGSLNVLNAGSVTGYFVPTSANAYWKYVKVNLAPNLWEKPNVRFKFKLYGSTNGNNFYIDDINIGAFPTGVENISSINAANLYPNPAEYGTTLNLSLAATSRVVINVVDIWGKKVMEVFNGTLTDGETQIPITTSSLAKGVYIVQITAGESVLQKKLVLK